MSRHHEVGESSNTSTDEKKLPPHVKEMVEALTNEIKVFDRHCYVLAGQVRYIENRLDESQNMVRRLKREWVGKLSNLTGDSEEQTREITDDFEGKVRNLKAEYDNEKLRQEEIIRQYRELQSQKADKLKLIDSLKNEYSRG